MGAGRERARRRVGYTLIELMIIVTIIGVSVTAFAPGFGRAMAERTVSTATRELIRIGRRARTDTFGYLRAHTLWIQPATGTVQLLRGPTNSCRLTAWAAIQGDCASKGQRCVENVILGGSLEKVSLREELRASAGSPASYTSASRALCYAPSGIVYYGSSLAAELREENTPEMRGGFVYALYRPSGGDPTAADRVHRVLFPLGATPRSAR